MTDPPTVPKRIDVLAALWRRTQWLDALISRLAQDKIAVSEKNKQLVYMCQVHAQLCKTALYGLKDNELEDLSAEVEKIKKHLGMIPK